MTNRKYTVSALVCYLSLISQPTMAIKSRYEKHDIQFIERVFLLGLKDYSLAHPTNTEVDFLEQLIAKQRKRVGTLKTEWYESKARNTIPTAFFEDNIKRQNIYLDLLLEKKKAYEHKKITVKK
jgi:hypothetical protein